MWHWKQTAYNNWRLTGPTESIDFASYQELFHWCRARGVDAQQV